jgi:hypothetical protein
VRLATNTLETLTDVGFFDLCRAGEFNFVLFHVIEPSFASLEEIAEVLPYTNGLHYFVVKNFINETSFFDWHPEIRTGYFKLVKNAVEVHIPKPNELAYELTSRPSSRAFRFPPSLPTRLCRGTSRITRWCCAAMCRLGLRKSALSTIGFVSSIGSVENAAAA